MTTAERLTAVAENVQKVYEAGVRDGFTPPESEYLTPEYIYKTTRPGDWLTMPTPGDDEMYFLVHLPVDEDGFFATTFTFSSCVLDFGTVVNGEFVSIETATPVSGTRFTKVLDHTKYGNVTADGWKQCMVRAKGKITDVKANKPDSAEQESLIKDFVCGAWLNLVFFGDNNTDANSVQALNYIRFVGNGGMQWLSTNFSRCRNLRIISFEKKSKSTQMAQYVANLCMQLEAVSDNLFSSSTIYGGGTMLFAASGIKKHPTISTPLTTCASAFSECYSLQAIDGHRLNTVGAKSFDNFVSFCVSLRKITNLDISAATNFSNAFYYCGVLQKLTFAGSTTPGDYTINLSNRNFRHNALVEMIASLPTATAAATITITGTPGASELTDAEIAVATAKNWTITR